METQLREKPLRGNQTHVHYLEDKTRYKAVALT